MSQAAMLLPFSQLGGSELPYFCRLLATGSSLHMPHAPAMFQPFSRQVRVVSHPTHGFYTWVGGGEAIYAADGTLTQHNSLKFWDKRKRSKKYTCCGLQDYSLQISLRSASGWWRTSSLHFVYVIFLAPPVLKTLKISYGLGFYTLKDFLWWTMPLISILNCKILSTSILFLGV